MRQPAIYIVTNKRNGTLYIGVTSDLIKRVYQHKQGEADSFTKHYGCKLLVYYELYEDMLSAITRENNLNQALEKRNWY